MKPNDPLFDQQWHLKVLEMESVWDREIGNSDAVVAVIESGFDTSHPDLKNQIPKSINTYGSDDEMLSEEGERAETYTDHGTHVIGLIAAEMNNGEGGTGVAPGCRLLPIKIRNLRDDDMIARAIRVAVEEGARVINLSNISYKYVQKTTGNPVGPRQSSPPRSDSLFAACEYAIENDVLICTIVGGNQGFMEMIWPAAYNIGLNVLQGDLDGQNPSNFCQRNAYADVLSPAGRRTQGANTDTPFPGSRDSHEKWGLLSTIQTKNGSYGKWTGGCQATAVASGVAALLYSHFPGLNVLQAREVIRNTAKGHGWDDLHGHGYINPKAIVNLDRIECEIAISGAMLLRPDKANCVEVTLSNRGILDARDMVVLLYTHEVDTPEARQIFHKIVSVVRGGESVSLSLRPLPDELPADDLWIVVDTGLQLSDRQKKNRVWYLKERVKRER